MRNFNTISNFLGANALQFLGGGNSQNEVRKTEGEQPRNRQRISNLSLTLVSTFVRYAVCIALLLCLCVGQMWGSNVYSFGFNDAIITAYGDVNTVKLSNPSHDGTVIDISSYGSSGVLSGGSAYVTSSSSSENCVSISNDAGENYGQYYVEISSTEDITNVYLVAAVHGSTTGSSAVAVGWTGAPSADISEYHEFSTPGKGKTSGNEISISFSTSGIRYVRIYRKIKLDTSTSTHFQNTSSTTHPSSASAFSIAFIKVTTTPPSNPTWYTLSYDANDGTGSIPAQDFISGTTVYAAHNSAITRSGYIFKGWNTAANGSGTSYAPGASFTLSANTTLYAQWGTASTSGTYCISLYNLSTSGEIKYFTYSGANDDQVLELALPSYNSGGNNYWVGKGGEWKGSGLGNSNAKSAEAKIEDIPIKGNRSQTVGTGAQGVLGTLHVYDNSTYDNLYIEFEPKAYALIWGEDDKTWTPVILAPSGYEHEWISQTVTLTSTQLSSFKYYVGLLKSDNGVYYWYKSNTSTFSSMGTYNKRTDTWGGNVSTLSAGATGHFRMWEDATSYDNWRCHFVVDYALKYNANNGTGAPATVYVPAEGDDSHRTIKLSSTEPTRDGYSFKGWATSSSRASSGTVDYAAGAYITVSADTELFAVWECVTPTIGTDLSTSTVNYYVGASASALTVAATAGGGTVSYQWYSNTANSTTSPTPTSLTTGTSYTPSTASAGTTYYFCVVTNTTGSCSTTATSNITPVTVSRKTPTAYSVTGTASICSGGNTDITLSGSQVGASYQLKKDGSASGDPVSGTGSALVWNVSATGAYTVSAVQTTAFTDGDMSGTATVSLKTATSVSFSDYTLDATVDDEFEITGISAAGSGTLLYQWYSYSDDEGSGETEIDGAEKESYTFTPDAEGNYYFKCAVTGDCGTVKSDIITVTATVPCSAPSTPSISGTQIYAVGDDIELTATCASGADGSTTYTWYKGANWATASASSPVQAAATGSSGYTLTIDDCTADAKGLYWCEASNGSGCEAHNTTGYSVDVPLGDDHVLIWNMTFTSGASSLFNTHSESSTSSYLKTQTALAVTGLSLSANGKENATPKLAISSSEDNTKCAYVTFVVEEGYQFTPDSVILSTTAVSNTKTIVVEMGSNKQSWSQSKSNDPVKHNYNFSSPVACTGTVTLKIHGYHATNTDEFRIGSPIKIYGTVEEIPEEYTISFEGNGNTSGSTASVTNIASGSDVNQITANGFTKTGHNFAGWQTNTALTYVAYGDEDTEGNRVAVAVDGTVPDKAKIKNVTSDITLTAQWTPRTYNIKYYNEAGDIEITGLSPTTYTYGVGVAELPTPEDSACHTFDGWYSDYCVHKDNGGSGFGWVSGCKKTSIGTTTYGDCKFLGVWTLNSHTLTWNFNGGSTSDDYTAGGDVNCGTSLTYPTLSKTGYTFSSWSSDATEMPDEDLTITASWTANTYSVTLDPDNGSPTSTVTATYDADMPAKLSDGKTAVVVPTFSGYTFGGYYDNHAGAGKQYYTNAVASANTWDKASTATLYAKWTQTVTLETGSKGSGDDLTPTILYKGSALSGFTTGHTAYGYKLLGYYTASSDGTKVLNADGTFAASNVTDYITDGAWTKTGATTLYAQWEDMMVELPGTLDKDNYIAKGGGLTFDGNYFNYGTGTSSHLDGYAEWKVNIAQKCVYELTLDGNYPNGHQWKIYLINGSDTLTTCVFDNKDTKDSYTETKQWDLSGISSTGVYILRIRNIRNWGEPKLLSVAIDPIKVTYDANGGTCATASAYYAGSALTLPTPTRSGYVFEGWYNDSGTKIGNAGASYEPTASITLTAKWAPIIDLPGTLNKANMETYGEGLTFRNDTLDYGTGSNHHRDGYADWKVNVEKCVYIVTTDGYYPNGHQWKVYLISGSDTLSTCVFDNNNSTGSYTETKQWDLSGITSAGVYTIRMRNIRDWGEPRLKSVTISPITVTYDANGGSCATESAVYGGSALTLPTPTWSGYTFEGWYNAGVKVGDADDEYTPTEDITLYAHWTDNISGKVFSYIDNNYGDKFKAFDLSGWVSSDQTGKDKTYTNGTTGVKFVVDDGAWDNKSNSISALAKYKNGSTKDSIIIPTGKIATVKISYGAYYDTEKKKKYGPLTIGGSTQTAVTTVLNDGMTNAQVDAALEEITLSNQQDTLILGSDHDNIFIGRVSAVITGYVITYATGDYGSGDSFTATKTAGSSYTISSTDDAFTRTNCVYDGWSTNADGSTKDYAFGASYTTDAPLTLYPHWVATCATPSAPTGFSAGSITDDGVTFTITDAGDAGNYDIYYSTTSTAPTSSTDATTTATTKTPEVTGLSEGTTYYAWVRAVCDEDHKSSWVALNPGGDTHTFFTHYTVTMGTVTTRQHDGETVGGTISSDVSHAAEGDEVTLTATPTSGYAFVSWTIEKTSDNSDVTSTVLSGDNTLMMPAYGVTVKATFAEQFTIVYKDEDKTTTLDGLEPTFYLYGIGVPTLPTPTKTGYTFDSWYNAWCVDSKNEGSWEDECRKSSIGTTDYSNATYYAKWTAIDYTVTHSDAENGTYTIQVDDASATDETTTANIGQTITLSATPSSGYALSAWNVTSGGEPIEVVDGEFTMPAADVTIAPTFGVVYTVTFNSNGGSAVDAIEQDAPGAAIEMPTAPTKSGYDFVNWMIGGETFDPADSYTPTANITAYATWKAECETSGETTTLVDIDFKSSAWTGKTFSQGNTTTPDTHNGVDFYCKHETRAFSLANNTTDGLTFPEGNMSSGNQYFCIPLDNINGEITVTLKHVSYSGKQASYKYYFWDGQTTHTGGNTNSESGTPISDTNKGDTEMSVTVSASNANHKGLLFIGRNSSSYTQITGVTVTTPAGTCYYVTYDGNGATGGYVNDAAAHENNDFVIVSSNAGGYTRTGNYEFNGWNTKADGTGTDFDYYSYPNDHFRITKDTTLYAQWRIVIDENTSNLTAYEDPAHKDVRVTNGAKLTLTQDTTVRNMLVETGSTLNVAKNGEEGIKLTAKRLSLQGGWGTVGGETKYDMPRVYIDPASKIKKRDTIINFDLAVNNACYYPFALPFDVPLKISAGKDYSEDSCMVDYTHHTLAYYSNYGANGQFAIKTYDGQSRANNGGSSANWKHVAAGATLKAGHGYALTAIALGGIYGEYAVIRFPMKVDNAWLTAGEIGHYTDAKSVEHIKDTVHVTAYKKEGTGEGTGDQTPKANIGWNLLGVPYMACYTTSGDMYNGSNVEDPATLIQGRFNYSTNKWEDGEIMYVTVPVHDFSEYVQADITDSDTKLLPGWCFFVQVAETGNLRFLSASETESSSLPIYAPKREKADMPTVKTGIILSGAETSDKTTILVSDRYSAAEYEINADLEKMFGENSYTLATYSLSGETRLAYNAMSNADAANIIPIGYRVPAEGSYTFDINPRYAQNEAFEHVNLIDYETGFVTDLLQASYTFSSDRTQNDSRFALNVVKIKETPTGIENGADGANDAKGVRKLLLNDKLYIILDNKMYDATGRMVK